MTSSPETTEVLAALHKVWGELEYVQKDAQGQGYKYVSDLTLTSLVHPILAKHSLMLVPTGVNIAQDRIQDTSKGAHMFRCDAVASYRLWHTSGQGIDIQVAGSAFGQDKQTTSALTACHKLAIRQLLMLATGEDNEKPPSGDQIVELFNKAKSIAGTDKFKPFCALHWGRFSKGQQDELAALAKEKK